MAYTRATRLPDRYKVVFQNASGARVRAFLTQAEFERKDRDAYVQNAYAPTGRDWQTYHYWFVPYIVTFDTPSGDLEDGMVWEGTNRFGEAQIMWKAPGRGFDCAKPDEIVVTRSGDVPDVIARKA